MQETWKDILGYEGFYKISSIGRVYICRTNKIKASHSRNTYLSVLLSKNAITKNFTIHRLVAVAFLPNPLNKAQVNHINGIKTDNRVENLEWSTSLENIRHSIENNLKNVAVGSRCRAAKLNDSDVIKIRSIAENFSRDQIGRMFGVTGSTVRRIVSRKIWKHV